MLVRTSAGALLNSDAAASYEALNAAFTQHFGYRLSITSGARTNAEQEQIFRQNYTTIPISGRPRVWWNGQWWYQRPGRPVTAKPGTSNHEYPPGKAADFGSGVATQGSAQHNWMLANAGNYGWEWTGRNFAEPWHWEKNWTWAGGGSGGYEGDDFLMGLLQWQQEAIFNALYSPDNYYKTDAITNILQSIQAGNIRWPGAPYNAFEALMNDQRAGREATLAAINSLDSGADLDLTALEETLKASEERQRELTENLIEGLSETLHAEILKGLSQVNGVTVDQIEGAVNEAFDTVFVRPNPS